MKKSTMIIVAGVLLFGLYLLNRDDGYFGPCPWGTKLLGTEGEEQWCAQIENGKEIKQGMYKKWFSPDQLYMDGQYKKDEPCGHWKCFTKDNEPIGCQPSEDPDVCRRNETGAACHQCEHDSGMFD